MRRFSRLRSAYYLVGELRNIAKESPARARNEQDRLYADTVDPWRHATSPPERERHAIALELLDSWRRDDHPQAFEIACAEGVFTAKLAPRCESLLAVDISDIALRRAEETCKGHPNVRFERWDAVTDQAPATFDLVVCMDMLETGWRPRAQRRAIEAAGGAVRPGGALLLTAVRRHPVIEDAAWAHALGRGASGIGSRIAAVCPQLAIKEKRLTDTHLIVLFEARPEDKPR